MSQSHYTAKFHGRVTGNTYRKTVTGSIHRLRKPIAWAIDCADLAEAERRGAVRIEILDLETQITYMATIEYFRAHALTLDRGFGRQLALEIRHWSYTAPLKMGGITAVKAEPQKPQNRQISFLEGVKYGR